MQLRGRTYASHVWGPRFNPWHLHFLQSTVLICSFGLPGNSDGKELACNAEDPGLTPGWEDPLEKGMKTHSSILAWRIPWTEEPDGYSPWIWKESNRVKSFSHVQLFVTPWMVAYQAPGPCDFPGKNTGVGCDNLLLQGLFPLWVANTFTFNQL